MAGNTLLYRQIDVRDVDGLNEVVRNISETQGKLDGLIAAAGIQQETPALDYTAKDANTMFEVNVTGVFMTAQAVAKEMIRHGNGGSIAMIASMSGTVANRVSLRRVSCHRSLADLCVPGSHLSSVQRFQGWRSPARTQPRHGVGNPWNPSQHHLSRIHRDSDGGGPLRAVSR